MLAGIRSKLWKKGGSDTFQHDSEREEITMERLTRRHVIHLGATAATAATVGMPAFLRAQSNPVVMLGVWPFTGGLADSGPHLDHGMKLAIEE